MTTDIEQKYEMVASAIRNNESMSTLRRIVGPSEADLERSKLWLARMDELSPQCDWENMQPSEQAVWARERHKEVELFQSRFENDYL